ncbi:hypothetical protein ACHAXR_007460, partial [Thalassiosira sp. AJA248-18]
MGRKYRSSSHGNMANKPLPSPSTTAAATALASSSSSSNALPSPLDLTACHTLVNHFLHGKDADGRTVLHRAIEAASSSSSTPSSSPSTSSLHEEDKLDGLFLMNALPIRMKELDALSTTQRAAGGAGGNNKINKQKNSSHLHHMMLLAADDESGYTSLHYAILRRDLMTLLVLLKHASSSSSLHPLRLLDGNIIEDNDDEQSSYNVINDLAASLDHEQLTPLQLLGRTSSNGLENCRRTLQWKSLRKMWKKKKGSSQEQQHHQGELLPERKNDDDSRSSSNDNNSNNHHPRRYRRRMISFGDDRDYDTINYDIEEDPDRVSVQERECRARSGSFNVDLDDDADGDDEDETNDTVDGGANNDLIPLEDDVDFRVLASSNSGQTTSQETPKSGGGGAKQEAQHAAADDYGCEVLTFGRADHCALGVPQFTTSGRIRERGGEDNFSLSSSSTTTSYKPKRVETFALGELRRKWSSSSSSPSDHDDLGIDSPAVSVAASTHHTLVSTRSGQLFSFGLGKGGRLGTGDESHRPLPTQILGPLTKRIVASIAAAENHSLCSTSGGDVYAWGSNGFGQLGILSRDQNNDQNTNNNSRLTPRRVEGVLKQSFVVAVAAGDRHSVALTRLGEVYCWGDNRSGQLGMFSSTLSTSSAAASPSQTHGRCCHRPQRVEGLWSAQPRRRAIAIAAAEFSTLVLTMPPTAGESSLVSLPVNTIYGWGHGNHSPMRVIFPSVGTNSVSTSSSASGRDDGSAIYARSICINPIAIACAKYHNVAITADGRVYTWGLHSESLGIEKSPAQRKNNADSDCWAMSESKRPSNNQSSAISSPQLVVGMLFENGGGKAVAVSASESHTAVVTSDGHLFTWGTSHGNDVMGHKGVRWQPSPRKVKRVHRAVGVAAAKEHTALLMGTSFPPLPHYSSTAFTDDDGCRQPLSLQDSAAVEISRNVDLFNVIPIALVAHRLNCRPLTIFCAEFVRKNLDGVLAVGNKNDFATFLSSRSFVGATRKNDFDGIFHPFLYRLANSKTWVKDGRILLKQYSGSMPPKKARKPKRDERRPSSIPKEKEDVKTDGAKIVAEKEAFNRMKSGENSIIEGDECQEQEPRKLFEKAKAPEDASKYHCSVCGIYCPDCDSYTFHVNGRKHRNRLMHTQVESEKQVAETMMAVKRMQLMENNGGGGGGVALRGQHMSGKPSATKPKAAWGMPKAATPKAFTSSGKKARSK